MNDSFWKAENRINWPAQDPNKKFLGHACIQLGEVLFKERWTGVNGAPDPTQALEIQRRLSAAAVAGDLKTYHSSTDDGDFGYKAIPGSAWVYESLYKTRFALCKIDPKNPTNKILKSDTSEFIFCDTSDLFALLQKASLSLGENSAEFEDFDGFVSTYLLYMIHHVKIYKYDEKALPRKSTITDDLLQGWIKWRKGISHNGTLPKNAVLTPHMAKAMASIIGGEEARAAKGQ
jgi:hypothetical protein